MRYPRFCTYIPYSPISFQTPFQGDLHNSVWPLTSRYFNKISNPFLGEFTLLVPQDSEPLSRRRPSQNLVCFYQYPRYRSHSRETSQNTSNIYNFSNSNPSHSLNYRTKGILAFSRQHHWCPEILPDLRLKS